ncbi:MAG: GNAT family N-acetyltransferase [Polyangiaceae bacterium]
MIEYRSFRNSDPPHILRLWQNSGLGRGAASGLSADQFDDLTFAQPYFDPQGLIVACDADEIVGYVHAGFGATAAEDCLCRNAGVICAVIVAPESRRQGVGRRLVELAENYLRQAGATSIHAGAAAPCDPFYFGLYGGSQPAGFLQSDAAAGPFFERLGYQPDTRHLVWQRQIGTVPDPVGMRLMSIRRATQLAALDPQPRKPWWWQTRPGRLDTVHLGLMPKAGGAPLAEVTVVGLDLYIPRWQVRPIGLMELKVSDKYQRKGYGQALIVEVCRRMREEMVGLAEAHARSDDHGALAVLKSAGFKEVDVGVVYRKV